MYLALTIESYISVVLYVNYVGTVSIHTKNCSFVVSWAAKSYT